MIYNTHIDTRTHTDTHNHSGLSRCTHSCMYKMIHSTAKSLHSSWSHGQPDWCYFCCSVLDCLWTFITGPSMLSRGRWPSLKPHPTAPAGAPIKQTTHRCHAQWPSEPPCQHSLCDCLDSVLIHARSTPVPSRYPPSSTTHTHFSPFSSQSTPPLAGQPTFTVIYFFIGCFVIS